MNRFEKSDLDVAQGECTNFTYRRGAPTAAVVRMNQTGLKVMDRVYVYIKMGVFTLTIDFATRPSDGGWSPQR